MLPFYVRAGETFDMQADGIQYDINGFQELIAMEIVRAGQVNARATLVDFMTQTIKAFSSSSGKFTAVRIAGSHVAFGFDDAGFQQAFCSSVNMP